MIDVAVVIDVYPQATASATRGAEGDLRLAIPSTR
jgi:hypothetical protein